MGFSDFRIGLIGPLPPPAGGMANQTRQLAELLRAENAQVTLVQTNAPYRPAWVGNIPVARALFRLIPYLWSVWRAAGDSNVVHVMANSGWSWHLFAAPAIWLAWLRGVPVVVNYRGGEAADFLARAHRSVRASMRRVSLLIVPSSFLQQVFAGFAMHADIVPNIVDLKRFHARADRRGGAAHIVVARNLEPLYDNSSALRAFQIIHGQLADARLTIAGSGPEARQLQDLARELGLQEVVTFTGRLDRDAMAALLRSADVSINPSLADNMPNSILESLASGVPVVSTNVGGIPHMVEHGTTALLVAPSDAQAMAESCLLLLRDDALWQRMSEAGRAAVQRYTWQQVAPLFAQAYGAVVSGPSPSLVGRR